MKLLPEASFGQYADVYDLLYAGKDYQTECDFVESMASVHGVRSGRTLLDIGCGTAAHLLPLAKRGWDVVGVDLSASMLARARRKTAAAGLQIDLRQGDIRHLKLDKRFDVVTCMFAVLGYITDTRGIASVFAGVRAHLNRGGVFVMDAWYGPAVLMQQPKNRRLTITRDGLTLTRRATPRLDALRHVVEVRYDIEVRRQRESAEHFAEHHRVRFFFRQEIVGLADAAGLEICELCPFMAPGNELTAHDWNFSMVARAK
jgi:SAM-dependent methyltransferase